MPRFVDVGDFGTLEFPDDYNDQQISQFLNSEEFKSALSAEGFEYEEPDLSYLDIISNAFKRGELSTEEGILVNANAAGLIDADAVAFGMEEREAQRLKIPVPKTVEEWHKDKGWLEQIGLFLKSPLEIGLDVAAEGFGTSLPALGGAIAGAGAGAAAGAATLTPFGVGAGAIVGGLGGLGIGDFFAEFGGQTIEHLAESGYNLTDADSVAAGLQNEEVMNEGYRQGAIKGGVVATFDVATAGLAGKLISAAAGKALSTRIAAALGEVGFQMAGGGAGEAVGTPLATGKAATVPAIMSEIIGEVIPGVGETTVGAAWRMRHKKAPVSDREVDPDGVGGADLNTTIDLDDDKQGQAARYGDEIVKYMGKTFYNGEETAMIISEQGAVGHVPLKQLTFYDIKEADDVAVGEDARPIPDEMIEPIANNALFKSVQEQIDSLKERKNFAIEAGLIAPTPEVREQINSDIKSINLDILKKQNELQRLSRMTPKELAQEMSDPVAVRMRRYGVKRPEAERIMRAEDQGIDPKFIEDLPNYEEDTLESLQNEYIKHTAFQEKYGRDYKSAISKMGSLARALSNKDQNTPRDLDYHEQRANRKRPIKKSIQRVAEIKQMREDYNALRRQFGLKPITNWDRVYTSEITKFAFKNGMGLTPGLPRFQRAFHGSDKFFDKFSGNYERTGTGHMTFGHGLYFGPMHIVDGYLKSAKDKVSGRFNILDTHQNDAVHVDPDISDFLQAVSQHGKPSEIKKIVIDALKYYQEELETTETQQETNWKPSKDFYSDELQVAIDALETLIARNNFEMVKNEATLYEVDLKVDDNNHFVWDQRLSEQSQKIQDVFKKLDVRLKPTPTGEQAYKYLARKLGSDKAASHALMQEGIVGHKFLNGTYRQRADIYYDVTNIGKTERKQSILDNEEAWNWVIYDDNAITIMNAERQARAQEEYISQNLSDEDIDSLYAKMRAELDRMGLNDVHLKMRDVLFTIDPRTGEVILLKGRYHNATIEMAYNATDNPMNTLSHEAFHHLWMMEAFTQNERDVLRENLTKWRKDYKIDERYPEASNSTKDEEAMAHAFGDWYSGATAPAPLLQNLFNKILRIWEALGNLYKGLGYRTAEEVFADIKGGRFAGRAELSIYNDYGFNPNDRLVDQHDRSREKQIPRNFKFAKAQSAKPEVDLQDLTWFGRVFNSMRHVASKNAAVGRWMTVVERIRGHRMDIADEAAKILAPHFQKLKGEALVQFNKAAEISQLVPGAYKRDELGRIVFTTPANVGTGKNSKLIPNEVVVLEGVAADAYEASQKALKMVLDNMKRSYLAGVAPEFLKLKDLGLMPHESAMSVKDIENLTWRDLDNLVKDIEGRITAIEFGLDPGIDLKSLDKDIQDHIKEQKQYVKKLKILDAKFKDIRRNIRDYSNFTKNDYFPLMRFGDHYIVVKNTKGEVLWYEQVETPSYMTKGGRAKRAQTRIEQIKDQFPAGSTFKSRFTTYDELRQSMNLKAGQVSMELAAQFMHGNQLDVFEKIRNDLNTQANKKGFRKFFAQRQMTPGYETDFSRAMTQYIMAGAGASAHLRFNRPLSQAFDQTQADKYGPNLRRFAREAHEYVNSPQEEYQTWRKLGFYWYLGGNVSSALLQTMSLIQFTGPYLSQFASAPRVAAELGKAFKEVSLMMRLPRGEHDYKDVLINFNLAPADVKEDLLRAVHRGIVKQQSVLEEFGLSPSYASVGRAANTHRFMQKVTHMAATPFNTVETFSRAVAFIAATRLARDPKVRAKIENTLKNNHLYQAEQDVTPGEFDSYTFAKFVVDETFGLYGKINRPGYQRHFKAVIFQFQNYIHQMFELTYRMMMAQGPEGKKAVARLMLMLFLTAGLSGLPGADDALDIYEHAAKTVSGIDPMTRITMREMIHDLTDGNMFAEEMVMNGVFNALGQDVNKRIALQIPGADIARAVLGMRGDGADVLGLPGSMIIENSKNAWYTANEGRWEQSLSYAMPTALKHIYEAFYLWPHEGVRSIKGDQVLTPEELDYGTLKAYGFTPTSVSKARREDYYQTRLSRNIQLAKDRYSQKLVDAYTDQYTAHLDNNDAAEAAASNEINLLVKEIIAHNQQAEPHNRIILNLTDINNRVKLRMYPEARIEKLPRRVRGEALRQQPLFER